MDFSTALLRTFCLCIIAVSCYGEVVPSMEQKLVKKLFTDGKYDKEIFPAPTQKEAVKVDFGMAVISLVDVDEKNQALVLNGWMRMTWTDYRLKWDPESYDNITVLRVSDQRVWRPDIFLYNSAKSAFTFHDQKVNLLIYSDGIVLWIPPKQLMSHCAMDMSKFPFDQHTCHLKFGSWTFDGNRLDLGYYEGRKNIDLSDYNTHDEWDVIKSTGIRNVKYYPCCTEPYPDMTYNITIARKSSYYSHIYIGPAVVMTLMIPFVFLLPPESREKITFGAGIMVCLVLMTLMLQGFLPSALSTAPVIAMYYSSGFILMGISTAISVCISCLYWRSPNSSPPAFLSKVLVDGLGRCLCVKRDDYAGASPDDDQGESDVKTKSPKGGRGRAEWRLICIVLDKVLWLIFMVVAIIMTIALFV